MEDPGSDRSVGVPPEAAISGVEVGGAARRLREVAVRLDLSVLLLETNINEGLTYDSSRKSGYLPPHPRSFRAGIRPWSGF